MRAAGIMFAIWLGLFVLRFRASGVIYVVIDIVAFALLLATIYQVIRARKGRRVKYADQTEEDLLVEERMRDEKARMR